MILRSIIEASDAPSRDDAYANEVIHILEANGWKRVNPVQFNWNGISIGYTTIASQFRATFDAYIPATELTGSVSVKGLLRLHNSAQDPDEAAFELMEFCSNFRNGVDIIENLGLAAFVYGEGFERAGIHLSLDTDGRATAEFTARTTGGPLKAEVVFPTYAGPEPAVAVVNYAHNMSSKGPSSDIVEIMGRAGIELDI